MIWQVIFTGLTLGMVSSFHCVGMCGPLALSLPLAGLSRAGKIWSVGCYHTGRIFTYSCLGLVFGLAGRRIYLAGLQQWFSIVLGLAILLVLVLNLRQQAKPYPGFLQKGFSQVQQWIVALWGMQSRSKFLLIGAANGLLPCGMVYVALALALSQPQINLSVVSMAMFGAGTLPAMLALSLLGHHLNISLRNTIKKAIPAFMAMMAILLILRGLNLGIPYISPVLAQQPGHAIICH